MSREAVLAALGSDYIKTLLITKSHQLSRQPRFRRSEQPDLEQELVAHVLKQAHHFDPSRASVRTFVARVIDSAFAMMVRERRRLKRAAGFRTVSLETTSAGPCWREGPVALSKVVQEEHLRRRCGGQARNDVERTDLSIDLAQAMAGLTPEQRDIATRLANAPEAAVARQLGISRRQVRNAVLAIRVHFEKAGLHESDLPGQPAQGRHR
jgi:RNA polymerase sigma factor (sigma-70 family)